MSDNPLLSILKEINPTLQFKSDEIILPNSLFENQNEGVEFPAYNQLLPAIGIFSEYMIETIVNEYEGSKIKVEQFLKKNDFPDLVYDEHLYEVKTLFDYDFADIKPNVQIAQTRIVNAKKVEELKTGFKHNGKDIKGVFLMVVYYTMEELDEVEKCRMVITKVKFYNLDGEKVKNELNKLSGDNMEGRSIRLSQIIGNYQADLPIEMINYIDKVKETEEGGN